MKSLKLIKESKKNLYNYHAGCGIAYLSNGTGDEIKMFPMMFFHRKGRYVLAFGNSKAIELTDEQIKEIGNFAVTDNG